MRHREIRRRSTRRGDQCASGTSTTAKIKLHNRADSVNVRTEGDHQPAFLAASSSHANSAFPYPLPLCAGSETKSATYMYLHGMLRYEEWSGVE
ncbi:g6279 [Coccomyxa elongata]